MRASNASDSPWMFFEYDAITMQTTYHQYVSAPGGKLVVNVRVTIPMWLAEQQLEENKLKAKWFTEMGGWKRAKRGAVIANIPDHIDQHFKNMCGYDPAKSGWYDRDKYNSFLDDPDYAHLRTGGGKIGRKKKEAVVSKHKVAKLIGIGPAA